MKKDCIKILLSIILFVIALVVDFGNALINTEIYIISYLIVGFEIMVKAFKNLFKGEFFDENFLMMIATIGAIVIGEYPEAVAVMLFYQVGEMFSDSAVDKSKESIEKLMNIKSEFANLLVNDEVKEVSPETIQIGDIILVKPGEKVPIDGIVVEGKSNIDAKALTGESLPKKVLVGEEILSGCINLDGVIKIKVTKEYNDSTVSKILDLVENANSRKSKSEKFITKFAKVYTPVVVFIALILAIVPSLIIEGAVVTEWIYRALSFLVVSCPCALVISIPLTFFGGIGANSRNGVLIKGSNFLEAISKAETVAFDKTGTLTEGIFEVQKVHAINMSETELLEIAACVENHSEHPIALSIKKAYGKKIDDNRAEGMAELSGRGIMAFVDSKEVLVGNEKLMNENNIQFAKSDAIGTVLYIAINKEYAGYILIADKIKNDAINAIKKLKQSGVKQAVMLTGDRENVAENVANELEIDKTYAELLPTDKVEKVEELLKAKSKDGKVIFAGDGINDAPVIARADIGIAMGALGSDAAIEAADVVIMTDEPSKIADAISISKKTMKIVKQNIIFAISVKVLVLILTAVGIATMWEAVFADVGVSMLAILNSLRMLKTK